MAAGKRVFLSFLFAGESVMAETISVVVGAKSYAVAMNENDAARNFMSRLPLSLKFENFGAYERIAYLDRRLETGSAPDSTTPAAGDFCYYVPWVNVAVFVSSFRFSEGLVPLGKFSPEALEAVKNSGADSVTFAPVKK